MNGKSISILLLIFSFCMAPLVDAQDNKKGSWLPADGKVSVPDRKSTGVSDFLKPLQGSLRPIVCEYEDVVLKSTKGFKQGKAQMQTSSWSCKINETTVADCPEVLDLDVTFMITEGELESGGVALAFDFTGWSRENYVLMPAYVYNGNRFHVETNGYMAPYPSYYYYNKNVPLLFSNSPRLSEERSASKIEALTGNLATPAFCFFSPKEQRGCIILTEQKSHLGNYGMFIEENASQDMATFVVSAPGVRELTAGFGDFRHSGDQACKWTSGDRLRMRFRIYNFEASGIPELLDKFMNVRKEVTGENNPRNLCPFSTVTSFTADYKNQVRWLEKGTGKSFYRMENSDGYQLGWVGGLMGTFAMLALDDSLSRERVIQTYDYVVSNMRGKSGYFYGSFRDGKVGSDRDNIPDAALVRKNSDALFFMMKHLMLFEQQGYGNLVKQEWKDAARDLAQAFVNTWVKNKDLGNYVNAATGEIIIYHSTSGAIAPAGLVLAARYFKENSFLKTAMEIAGYFYDDYVVGLGLTCAHSGDIMQDADADSAYGFMESLMALYYATMDKKWLSMAQTTAHLAATWTLSYDYEYPPGSTLYDLKANTAGAIWASVQNKHAAPGICTSSGDYLFKLFRATGQVRYADLLRDIIHAHAEVMETPGRSTTGMGPGTSMERIQTTDADGKGAVGVILKTSNGWTEDCGLLMSLEVPGIYVQTDQDVLYVFDHLKVEVVRRNGDEVTLRIANPTRFDAVTAVFAERSSSAGKPLGYCNFTQWKKVLVKAGNIVEVVIKATDDIKIASKAKY